MDLIATIEAVGRPIADVPRDGSLIMLMDKDVGAFPMRWGHIQRNGLFPGRTGMWVMSDGSMTWQDGEDEGPTAWCTIDEWRTHRDRLLAQPSCGDSNA